jgi:BolA protein
MGAGEPGLRAAPPPSRAAGASRLDSRAGMDRRARIEAKLERALEAIHVEVVDESHRHAGHAGAAEGGGHFRAVIVSPRFEGRSAVERQRLVYAALEGEMGSEIHALSVRTLTPGEWSPV